MGKLHSLPFTVGQLAESRSFDTGFRGAWFRCKIKKISSSRGHIFHAMEYYDYPDEEIKSTKLYQVPPRYGTCGKKSKDIKRQLMVRPQYPPIFSETQSPSETTTSGVAVIVNGAWKVGDMVDWLKDGCYWYGTVIEILDDNKVKIELPPKPLGEGFSYDADCKDLRPSLDWSPESGWTVPTPKDGGNSRCCARLIKMVLQANPSPAPDKPSCSTRKFRNDPSDVDVTKENDPSVVYVSKDNGPLDVDVSKEPAGVLERDLDIDVGATGIGKCSLSDKVSSTHVRDVSGETAGHTDNVSSTHVRDVSGETAGRTAKEDQYYCHGSSKRIKTAGSISLNSMFSDTSEAAIMDLEELVNKVKWLKGILEFGIPFPDAMRPSWKFEEHRAK